MIRSRRPPLAVEQDDLADAAGRLAGAWRPGRLGDGTGRRVFGLARGLGHTRAAGPRPASLAALGLDSRLPGSHAIPERAGTPGRVGDGRLGDDVGSGQQALRFARFEPCKHGGVIVGNAAYVEGHVVESRTTGHAG
jgi:hypothetical protein